jgi:L-arabinose transport system ATP-binding protein
VRALGDVGFEVRAGSVHGLLGENGAGKSTMMKILGGEYIPDEGEVAIDGQAMHFRSAADAIDAGVAVIHQELQYVPELSVMENLLLGRLPTRFGLVDRRRALAWIDDAIDDACRAWAARRPGATLLVRTQPQSGLTGEHVERLIDWAIGQQ